MTDPHTDIELYRGFRITKRNWSTVHYGPYYAMLDLDGETAYINGSGNLAWTCGNGWHPSLVSVKAGIDKFYDSIPSKHPEE